jgi:8-oxo-dGTP pyrophosphatase MutT (NUDIX family)
MREEKSCGAVVFRREGAKPLFLLLKYFGDYYDFPKGNQEQGENEKDTVRREVEEETGIKDIRFVEGFNKVIRYFYQRNGDIIHKQVSYYLVETSAKGVDLSYEHKGYQWLPFERALELLKFANSKEILRGVKEMLDGSLLRFQQEP